MTNNANVLVCLTLDEETSAEQAGNIIRALLKKHEGASISASELQNQMGMGSRDIVLSFMISMAASASYDLLKSELEGAFQEGPVSCSVELINVPDNGKDPVPDIRAALIRKEDDIELDESP